MKLGTPQVEFSELRPKNSTESKSSNIPLGLDTAGPWKAAGSWKATRTNNSSHGGPASEASAGEMFSHLDSEEIQRSIMRLPEEQDPFANLQRSAYPRVAHSVVLVALATNDVLHYAGNPDVSSPSVGCFILLPYVAAASWAMLFSPRITQKFSHRLSAIVLTSLQVTASLLSSCWRLEFKASLTDFGEQRAAHTLCLLQVLTAICHPLDQVEIIVTSLMLLISVIVLGLAQVAPALSILQDCILILCSSVSCCIGLHHATLRGPEVDVSTLMDLFDPFTNPDFAAGSKMRTNLDRLTGKLYATREKIRMSKVQTEWLRLVSSIFKTILKELANAGSLMHVADHELSTEPPVYREYFKKTFAQQGIFTSVSETEISPSQCECRWASEGGRAIHEGFLNVEEAVNHMLSYLVVRDPDHVPGLPLPALPGQMQDMVLSSGLGTWNFDMFKFSALCQGRPLVAAGKEALKVLNEKLRVDLVTMTTFLDAIEARYRSGNPYHNSLHATDVLNSMCYFLRLKTPSVINLTLIEQFSGMLASVAHDVGHTGQANRYHANALTPLALLYNDQAILENMHSAITFAVLQTKECNFLDALDSSARTQFRGLVIQMILDTDLTKHVQTVSRFKQEMLSDEALKRNPLNLNQRKELLSFILKSADVGGSSKLFDLHLQWTLRINTEFFEQGDAEKNLGLACSPFCDRSNTKVAESQRGFFKFIVMPLYSAIQDFLSDSRMKFEVMHELQANFSFWEKYTGEDFNYLDPMSNAQALRKIFRDMEEKDGSPTQRKSHSRTRHSFGSGSEKLKGAPGSIGSGSEKLFSSPVVQRSNSDTDVLRIGRQET